MAKGKTASIVPQHVEEPQIFVPQIRRDRMKLTLVGDSPLVVHKWSEKAKRMMLIKQVEGMKPKKEKKDPNQDFKDSLYVMEDGKYGFPSVGFKAAAVAACRFVEGLPMTEARGAFHVLNELSVIESKDGPRSREDMVRVGMGVADIRYRGEFVQWTARIEIEYNPKVIGPEQIANLMNLAGFHVGIGEMRPGKSGMGYGRFHVE